MCSKCLFILLCSASLCITRDEFLPARKQGRLIVNYLQYYCIVGPQLGVAKIRSLFASESINRCIEENLEDFDRIFIPMFHGTCYSTLETVKSRIRDIDTPNVAVEQRRALAETLMPPNGSFLTSILDDDILYALNESVMRVIRNSIVEKCLNK